MPDGTINIYLDSTFTSVDEGYKEVSNELEFVDSDNIGSYVLPVVYKTEASITTTISKDVEFFAENTTIDDVDVVPLFFFRELSTDSGVMVAITEYVVDTTLSGSINNYVSFFTGYNTVSGTIKARVSYIGGENFTLFKSCFVENRNDPITEDVITNWNDYINYSGHTSGEGLPIPSMDGYGVYIVAYTSDVLDDTQKMTNVDCTFAGWVDFPILSDIYSVDAGITDAYTLDVQTTSGCVTPLYSDIYSSQIVTSGINFDAYCSLMNTIAMNLDVELTGGRVGYIKQDIYSTAVGAPTISCDIELYSLKITNFSLGIEEYTTASEYVSVDILDDVYGVSTSGTYLKIKDQIVPVTFSGIDDGYRMFYDPIDDFATLDGSTMFVVHAENNNEDVLEENFYLTFGYTVRHDNGPYTEGGFDYNTKVTVRVVAENYASCPKLTSDGHRFITEHRENIDLSASIVCIPQGKSTVDNLSAEIYPESTAYYYGKEFTVVIKAKDFAGNIMPNVVLQYKIEDKPI